MKRIRRIWLKNSRNERYSLNGESGVYASGLSSLGYALSPVFAGLSHGFFIPVASENVPQGSPGFTFWFTRSPYQEYQRLINWLASAGQLTLVYDPTGSQEYMMDVTINNIQKGELNEVGWLECPVSLYSCSPWYNPLPTELVLENSSLDEAKRYDYTYTEDLLYGDDATSHLSATLAGAGHIPGAIMLTYYGAITNPQIRLIGAVSGRTYGVCSVTVTLGAYDRLIFSSRHNDSFVKRVTASGQERDLLDDLDLSSNPYFHLPTDEPCTLSLEADSVIPGHADLLIYYYYRSV